MRGKNKGRNKTRVSWTQKKKAKNKKIIPQRETKLQDANGKIGVNENTKRDFGKIAKTTKRIKWNRE